MSSPGSRRSYLAALAAGIAVIAASTYGVSLTRAAQDVSAGAPSAVTASAIVSAPSGSTTAAPPSSPATPSAASVSAPSAPSRATASGSTRSSADGTTSSRSSRSVAASTTRAPSTTRTPSSAAAPPTTPEPTTQQAPPPATAAPAPAATQFKDGTYSATAEYNSPGGVEKVGVTVMIAGDVVTGSSLQLFGTGIAKSYQTLFQQNYAPQVTGKKIDTIKLAAVGGSSLTSGGFNAALEAIEAQARA